MTAPETGQQANAAGAQALALVHLGTGSGWTADNARAEASREYGGRILIPSDGDGIDV
jgi:ribonuclease BN (tRNA processing enzyme)